MKKALLIGINYIHCPDVDLRGCIDDVVNMQSMLLTHYGYTAENITILRDDTTDPALMPTRANMLAAMRTLFLHSELLSEVWFHYSGHGSQIHMNGSTTALDSVIVPVDYATAGMITDNDIYTLLRLTRCPTLMLMDCCHSGSVCELPWTTEYISGTNFQITKNNRPMLSNNNIYEISGCKDSQTSADFYDTADKMAEGAFTDSFLRALRANGYSAPIKTVYAGLCTWLASQGFTQKPLVSSSSPTLSWQFTPVLSTAPPLTPAKIIRHHFRTVFWY